MKILTLIIKQKWFDAILSGEKTVETREVRPTNTKYISYRDNNTGKVYPLSKWKKSDVMAYIKAKKLPEPISYNKN